MAKVQVGGGAKIEFIRFLPRPHYRLETMSLLAIYFLMNNLTGVIEQAITNGVLPTPPANIVIGGAAAFYKEIAEFARIFDKLGYKVLAYTKPPLKEPLKEYPSVHGAFIKALLNSDVYFVVNLTKDGVSGYIGAGVFGEILLSVSHSLVSKRKIRVVVYNYPHSKCGQDELELWMKLGWVRIL